MKTQRYIIEKAGCSTLVGYLFPDNVLWWERKGYKCRLAPF